MYFLYLKRGAWEDKVNHVEGPDSSISTKKSIVEIVNHDEIFMVRAITMTFLKVIIVNTEDWHALIDEDDERNMRNWCGYAKLPPVALFQTPSAQITDRQADKACTRTV